MSASSSSANKSALLLGCPHCNQLVTLPQAVSLQAIVRCPICHSTFPIHVALPSDVPELQVVSSEQFSANPVGLQSNGRSQPEEVRWSPDEKLPVAKALREGARRRHGRHGSAVNVAAATIETPSFDSEVGQQVVDAQQQTQSILSGQSAPPRRSRSRSAAVKTWVEIAKVVAGALLALPVSQLIIWWGLGLDPFGIGPKIGRVVPFVVPAKLQETTPDEPSGG